MGQSKLELAVGTGQWDAGLKKAQQSLNSFISASGGFERMLEKDNEKVSQFVQMMGKIDSTATTAKGKMNDYKRTLEQLTEQYNQMSDAQKNSIGQDYLKTIESIKSKYQEAKAQVESFNKSLGESGTTMNGTGGVLDQLASKFTVNIDALKLFDLGLKGAKAALDVAKDAFFASEANVDEWGRTIKGAEGLYEGFLNALNTGDISGYLTRMDDIVKAAHEAYNAMDMLQTMKTIQGPQFAKQEAENNRLRTMLMTGKWISAGDGRSSLGMKDGQLLTTEQMKTIERMLQNGMNTIVSLTKNELKQTGIAIDKYYNSLAKQNGMTIDEFRQGTSSWGAFSEKIAGYEAYKKWDAQARTEFARQGGRGTVDFDKSNPYAEYKKWGVFRVDKMDENSYNELVGLIKQQQQQQSQMYSSLGQAYRTINRAEGITVKDLMGRGGGGGRSGGGGSNASKEMTELQENQKRINELTQEYVILSDESTASARERREAIQGEISDLNRRNNVLKLYAEQAQGKLQGGHIMKTNLGQDTFAFDKSLLNNRVAFIDQLSKHFKDNPIIVHMDTANEDVKKIQKTAQKTAAVVGTIGQAFNSIENPAAKVAGTIAQAIANVALAYSQTLAVDKTNKSNIWSFIAAATASTISMVETISAIHSSTGYAQGGMIKGNSYSGDNIGGLVDGSQLVGLNAGEVVLNAAGQQNLAANLQGAGSLRGLNLRTKVKGTELLVWLDNSLAQSGRGELVTWGQ